MRLDTTIWEDRSPVFNLSFIFVEINILCMILLVPHSIDLVKTTYVSPCKLVCDVDFEIPDKYTLLATLNVERESQYEAHIST